MDQNKYFKLFADCISVKGASRSTVCDLNRHSFEFIPNAMFDLIEECKSKTFGELKAEYGEENEKILIEYFDFLEKKELGFWCDKEELERFPQLDFKWDYPALIQNSILDLDTNSNYDLKTVFEQLEEFGCKHIQIRSYSERSLSYWKEILMLCDESIFRSIEIITKYNSEYNDELLEELTSKFPRIKSIIIHSANSGRIIGREKETGKIAFVKDEINSCMNCGIVHPAYFTPNVKLFTEGQRHNTCLNRKVSIDVDGSIKNCPSMPKSYGNISDTTLEEALNLEGFKEAWEITKDRIDVCKDCEFRYICTDCRAYREDMTNLNSKPKKCNYDPYSTTWN